MFQKIKFRKLDFITLLLLLSILFDFLVLCFAHLYKLKYRDYIFQTGIIDLKGHVNPKIHVFLILCKKWRRKRI